MKKVLIVALLIGGTLPLSACFFPYDDGGRGRPYDHGGYYDRVGQHGYYDHNRDTRDGYYR